MLRRVTALRKIEKLPPDSALTSSFVKITLSQANLGLFTRLLVHTAVRAITVRDPLLGDIH